MRTTFCMCLLHDIGHAPFSHTCENLFSYKEKINNKNSKINKELLAEIKSHLDDPAYHVFEKDYFSLIMKNPPASCLAYDKPIPEPCRLCLP